MSRFPKAPYLVMALAVLIADQISKWIVETELAGGPSRVVIPGLLNFTYVRNTGVAFGLFPSHGELAGTLLLTLLGLAALAIVGVYFRKTPLDDRLLLAALGLILGGAVGNLLNRALSGAVTDFIDFYYGSYHWHTFNIADSAITVGILLMLVDMFRNRPQPEDESGETAPAAGR